MLEGDDGHIVTFEPDIMNTVKFDYCGGAMVYWIEPLTIDERVAGSPTPTENGTLLSFSKTIHSHRCSQPGVVHGTR